MHPQAAPPPRCIGVFDSGVGGLSVLRELHRQLPTVALTCLGDCSHAPYGPRPAADVVQRCHAIVEHLVGEGAALIVVACNTATAVAIESLRERWPQLPFVGLEPGVKPALQRSRSGRIAVMATSGTVASTRLRRLVERHAADASVHLQACPALASLIERGVLDGPELLQVLAPYCAAVQAADVDTVVLGCTHYPFVAGPIAQLLGAGVEIVDTAPAIARRVAELWAGHGDRSAAQLDEPLSNPRLRLLNTGDPTTMRRLAQLCPGFETVAIEAVRL
jgi:glutamate racemase